MSEQLRDVVGALPSLITRERRALVGTLDGSSYAELGPIIGGSPKPPRTPPCAALRVSDSDYRAMSSKAR